MNTTRNVTPQWTGEEKGNLGEREVRTEELTFAYMASQTDPKVQAAIESLVNGQLSIRMGPYIIKQLPKLERLKDEKDGGFKDRVRADMAKAFAAWDGAVDFKELLADIAENLGGRGKSKVDPMVAYLEKKWAGAGDEKQAKFIAKYELECMVGATVDEVVAAWNAQEGDL